MGSDSGGRVMFATCGYGAASPRVKLYRLSNCQRLSLTLIFMWFLLPFRLTMEIAIGFRCGCFSCCVAVVVIQPSHRIQHQTRPITWRKLPPSRSETSETNVSAINSGGQFYFWLQCCTGELCCKTSETHMTQNSCMPFLGHLMWELRKNGSPLSLHYQTT